jgi:hypothetical protein
MSIQASISDAPADSKGINMAERSPQRSSSKKPGKTLKEKRSAKREKKNDKRPLVT